MVKEVEVVVTVPLCTVTEYFNVVFDNKDTLQQYHNLEGDPDASISPWSIDTRIITFSVPLSGVPEVVKKAIGTSTLTIRETQHKTWHEDGSLTVTSEPILDFVGGSKFTTRAEFRVETDGPDCKVTAVVFCEAAGPWGLISTIEGFMATQAEKSVAGFLAFCTARCKGEALSDFTQDADFMDEEFLDAAETLSIASSGDFGGWDSQQLQPLLKHLEDNTKALQGTLNSLRSLVHSSPSKLLPRKQPSEPALSTGGLWLPILTAFVLGCCFGAAFQSWPRTGLTFRKA